MNFTLAPRWVLPSSVVALCNVIRFVSFVRIQNTTRKVFSVDPERAILLPISVEYIYSSNGFQHLSFKLYTCIMLTYSLAHAGNRFLWIHWPRYKKKLWCTLNFQVSEECQRKFSVILSRSNTPLYRLTFVKILRGWYNRNWFYTCIYLM